jgi:hypothetical protein
MSYRLLMAVDVQDYRSRSGAVQRKVQADLRKIVTAAAEHAGVRPDLWSWQAGGDGAFIVLSREVSPETLVDRFVRDLNAELRQHNRTASEAARLRVRVAVHHGPAKAADNGYSGAGPVIVMGLCNGGPLRAALAAAGADLGVIVSEVVFRGTVEAQETSLEPGDLRRVRLPELRRDQDAWIWLPGYPDLPALPFADGIAGPPAADPNGANDPNEGPGNRGEPRDQDRKPPSPPQPDAPPGAVPDSPPRDVTITTRSSFAGATIIAPGGTIIGGDQTNKEAGGE